MSQRKLLTIFFYTLLVLFIGRNLTFIPTWQGLAKEKNYAETLKEKTSDLIGKNTGTYSIYYKNLTRENESFEIDSDLSHIAASVMKVPLVISLYTQAENGKINLDEQVTIQESDIQDYGTGTLRYQKPGGTYSLRNLARLSLKESDNTAAHVLSTILGDKTIQDTIDTLGLSQTEYVENRTSVKDMGILFEKLYNGKLLNQAHTKEVLGFLTDTDIEDRLPTHLESATVYHKTGDAVGSLHDVGIIVQGDTVFFLGVMTSDIGDTEKQTKQTMANIAKTIVTFLQEHT